MYLCRTMPRTDNQKAVTAYIPLELYDLLSDFKSKEGLRSDSQAIVAILERFFGSNGFSQNDNTAKYNDRFEHRFKQIEARLDDLAYLHEGLKLMVIGIVASNDVPSTVPDDVPSDVPSTVPDDVPSDVPSTVPDDVPSDVPSTVPDDVPSDVLNDFVAEQSRKRQLLVICKVNRADLYRPLYWSGSFKKGFVDQLDSAQTYKESTVKQAFGKVAKSRHAPTDKAEFLSYRALGELETMTAAIAPN